MKWTKLKKILRVQVYLLVIGCVVTAATLARAYYAGNRLAEGLSEAMVSQLGVSIGSGQTLTVNGQTFAFSVSVVPGSPDSVLDKAEYYCANHSGDLQASFGKVLESPDFTDVGLSGKDASRLTTFRREYPQDNGGGGDIACFTRPSEDGKTGGIVKRIQAFSKSLMAGELGKAHYIKATPTADGKGTRVLAVYSEDSLDFNRMFPETGDAAGSDPTKVARPPNATRLFSARINETQHGTYIYTSTDSADAIIASYDESMKADGWERIDYMENPAEQHGRAYIKGNEAMFLGANETEDGVTDVSILLSGSRKSVEAKVAAE